MPKNLADKTLDEYREKWGAFYRWLCARTAEGPTVGDFTLEVAREYVAARLRPRDDSPPLQATSVGTHVRALRAIAARIDDAQHPGDHRLGTLRQPKVDPAPEARSLTNDELLLLVAAARDVSATARRNTALLALLIDVGPRVSELVSIDRADVDFPNRWIAIRSPAKRGLVRIVPLGSEAIRLLRGHLGSGPDRGPLFVQRGGERMTDNAVRSMLVRLSEWVEIDRVSPHDFRHTASTAYTAAGADEVLKNKVFGWRPNPWSMNQRYTHLTNAQIVAAHQRISPLDALRPYRRRSEAA